MACRRYTFIDTIIDADGPVAQIFVSELGHHWLK